MADNVTQVRSQCSFCGKDARDVRRMATGPKGVCICDDCIRLCREIVAGATEGGESAMTLGDMRPHAIKAWLDDHVIGQERAKTVLSVAVYNHFKRLRNDSARGESDVELAKGNILMIGPTGSGKTLLARTIAKKLGVPFTMADATSLTEAGYVGEDVESIVKNLWLAANRDAELAGRGIVCIDEVDKISRSGSSNSPVRDVGGEGVQQALLKVIESHMVAISPEGNRNRPQQELIHVNTSNVLFICAGSFVGLEEIIRRRISRSAIGFGVSFDRVKAEKSELLRQVRSEDLINFGLIPEFVGRVPIVVSLTELGESEMVEILWKPKNALVRQYQQMFELEGIRLRFHHEALVAMVAEATERGSGARGLRAILEEVMLDTMFDLPEVRGIGECVVTEESVKRREPPLLIPIRRTAA